MVAGLETAGDHGLELGVVLLSGDVDVAPVDTHAISRLAPDQRHDTTRHDTTRHTVSVRRGFSRRESSVRVGTRCRTGWAEVPMRMTSSVLEPEKRRKGSSVSAAVRRRSVGRTGEALPLDELVDGVDAPLRRVIVLQLDPVSRVIR